MQRDQEINTYPPKKMIAKTSIRLNRVQRALLLDAADNYADDAAPTIEEKENNFINAVLNALDKGNLR